MIVLRRVVDFEDHCNLRIKILDTEFREIVFDIEDQPVGAARKRLFNQKEGFHASVFISPGMTQLGPRFIRILDVQMDRDAARGWAPWD